MANRVSTMYVISLSGDLVLNIRQKQFKLDQVFTKMHILFTSFIKIGPKIWLLGVFVALVT